MIGEDLDRHLRRKRWQESKADQNRSMAEAGGLWVLDDGEIFGFIGFKLHPESSYGSIHNNGVAPARRGEGWGRLMVDAVLDLFREQGFRYAYVDTGLDPVHEAARRMYESAGFDRRVPVVEMWRAL
jgi:ribosomal protein S18 acetylase RimI-like enzyme